MGVTTSLASLNPKQFNYLRAQHLLARAGFGGSPRQIAALQAMGLETAVDHLVDFHKVDASDFAGPKADDSIIRPRTPQEYTMIRDARRSGDEAKVMAVRDKLRTERLRRMVDDRRQMGQIEQWWLARMISTPRPLEEKLTLLWHGHFATNFRTVEDSYLMLKQNDLFRRHAVGSFAELALGIIRDPAMIKFLNNDRNHKRKPNENLARELMELFTLGEGNYGERDIKEGARALTGYTYKDNEFVFERNNHDDNAKTILGQTAKDGEDFVKILLHREDCALFVAYKLYRCFVADLSEGFTDESKQVIRQLAEQLRSKRYELRPVLKTLFRSQHFYDPAIVGNKIKSPAELLVGTVRTLDTPTRDMGLLCDAMNMMGQKLFDPPSVAGWDGGRSWINTSTLFVRQNLATYLLTGKLPFNDGWSRERVEYEPLKLVERLPNQSPEAVVDHLMHTLLGSQPLPRRREQLLAFLAERDNTITSDTTLALLLLITAMPEYQLC